MIITARKKLVEKNILQKEIIDQPINAKSAHAAGNTDWRILCAATLLK